VRIGPAERLPERAGYVSVCSLFQSPLRRSVAIIVMPFRLRLDSLSLRDRPPAKPTERRMSEEPRTHDPLCNNRAVETTALRESETDTRRVTITKNWPAFDPGLDHPVQIKQPFLHPSSPMALQLTAVLEGGEVVLPLSLDTSATVEALAQQVYALSGLPPSQMQLVCNGRLLEPRHQPLSSLGVNSGGEFPSQRLRLRLSSRGLLTRACRRHGVGRAGGGACGGPRGPLRLRSPARRLSREPGRLPGK